MSVTQPFIETWKLVSCVHRTSDGQVHHPWGEDGLGRLIYTADGYMSGLLLRSHRPPFKSSGLFDGAPEEKIRAMDSYLSYSGTYERSRRWPGPLR